MLQAFTKDTIVWFDLIAANNNKSFFEEHRRMYESAVRGPFIALLEELQTSFGGEIHTFRINRDVRFSPDKTPYKTNISGYLSGRTDSIAPTYVELSSDGWFAGTGYHLLLPDQLDRFRKALLSDESVEVGAELREMIRHTVDAGYVVEGEMLKSAPKGVDKKAANIDLLRYKSIFMGSRQPFGPEQDASAVLTFISKTWNAGKPLCSWLDKHVGPSTFSV